VFTLAETLSLVQSHIPEAKLGPCFGLELAFVLPLNSVSPKPSTSSGNSSQLTPSVVRQMRAMVVKKLVTLQRNKRALFFQFIFPLLYVLLVLAVSPKSKGSSFEIPPAVSLSAPYRYEFNVAPARTTSTNISGSTVPSAASWYASSQFPYLADTDNVGLLFETALLALNITWPQFQLVNSSASVRSQFDISIPSLWRAAVRLNGTSPSGDPSGRASGLDDSKHSSAGVLERYLLSRSSGLPAYDAVYLNEFEVAKNASCSAKFTAFVNQSAPHGLSVALDYVANVVFAALTSAPVEASVDGIHPGVRIVNAPFQYPLAADAVSGNGVLMAILVGIAFSSIPAAFGVGLVRERECRSKQLQTIMGVRIWVYWASHLMVDLLLFLIPTSAVFVLFLVFGNGLILGVNGPASFLLFILFGFSSTTLAYCTSLAFKKATTAQGVLSALFSM